MSERLSKEQLEAIKERSNKGYQVSPPECSVWPTTPCVVASDDVDLLLDEIDALNKELENVYTTIRIFFFTGFDEINAIRRIDHGQS